MFLDKAVKNKALFVLLALTLAGCFLSACTGSIADDHITFDVSELDDIDHDKKYENEVLVTILGTKSPSAEDPIIEDLYAPLLKEKFNVKLDMIAVSSDDDYNSALSLRFASRQKLNIILGLRPERMLNTWIVNGNIQGFTKEDMEKRLPNFLSMWDTEQQWDSVYANISHSDGKVYYFPGKRPSKVNMAWIFRKDLLDELNVTQYPENSDELYNLMLRLKEHTGKTPYVGSAGVGKSPLWAFSGFLQIFDMPELIVRTVSYVDPRTGVFYPYAFDTEDYREFLIYMNKLHGSGLIDKNFMTATNEDVDKLYREGSGHVLYGYPDKIASTYNELSRHDKKDAIWDWSRNMIGHDPENGVFFKREPYFTADGISFSSYAASEEKTRAIDLVNWMFSEEGAVLHTFGFEDITYKVIDGHYTFTDIMKTPLTAFGNTLWQYGIIFRSRWQHNDINEVYNKVILDVENAFINRDNYYFHEEPVLSFTDGQTQTIMDLEAGVNDVRDDYAYRFITGQLDPADDLSWNWYIDALNRVGLETVKQVRTEAYSGQSQP